MFRSLYRMHAFNGDPHPGNYLFHDDGTVTFLDFGLVKHFSADEMHTFGSMVKAAAVDHDHAEFRRIVEDAGMLTPDAPVSTDAVGEYFSPLLRHRAHRRRDDLDARVRRARIVRHTFDRTSPITQYATVPRAFVFIQRINLGLYALLGELERDAATTGGSPRSCGRSSTGRRRPNSAGPRRPGSPPRSDERNARIATTSLIATVTHARQR